MAQQIVAIDVHTQGARLARVEASLRRARLGEVTYVPFAADADAAERIAAIEAALGGGAESIVLGIDAQHTSTRLLHFPFTDPRKLSAAVEFEIEGQIPYPLAQVALAYTVAERPVKGAGADVLAAVVPRSALTEQLGLFTAAGLEPRAMVLPAVGLAEYLALEPQRLQGICYIGEQQTHLAIGRGKLAYARTLRFGQQDLEPPLAPDAALPPLAETIAPLVAGLLATFVALPASCMPERLFLTGSAPHLPELATLLTERLNLEVACLDVAAASQRLLPETMGSPAPGPAAGAGDAIALGMALAMFRHGHDVPLNLRRGPLAYRGDFQVLRDQLPRLGIGLLAVLAAAVFSAGVRFSTLRDQENKLSQGFCEATLRIVGRPICDPTAALATLRATPGAQSTPIPSYSASALLDMVSKSIPPELDVVFDELELRVDNGSSSMPERLTGKGEAASFDVAEQLLAALKRDACVQEAELGKQQRTQSGRVSFGVVIKVACPTGVQPGSKLQSMSAMVAAAGGAAAPGAGGSGPGTSPGSHEGPPP
jgi:general secretion pathway protein L